MAALNSTSSNSSAYALIVAYALVVLSLWKIDTGLVERPGFTAWDGNNAVATRFAPTRQPMTPAPKSIVSSHQCFSLTLLHQRRSEQIHRMKNSAD
jgi:hypothetical protein